MKDIELLVSLCQVLELLVVTFLSIQDQCGIFRKRELISGLSHPFVLFTGMIWSKGITKSSLPYSFTENKVFDLF